MPTRGDGQNRGQKSGMPAASLATTSLSMMADLTGSSRSTLHNSGKRGRTETRRPVRGLTSPG
jgi:hypothetical protein